MWLFLVNNLVFMSVGVYGVYHHGGWACRCKTYYTNCCYRPIYYKLTNLNNHTQNILVLKQVTCLVKISNDTYCTSRWVPKCHRRRQPIRNPTNETWKLIVRTNSCKVLIWLRKVTVSTCIIERNGPTQLVPKHPTKTETRWITIL